MNKYFRFATALAALTLAAGASAATSPPTKNVVLVHGAFADGSGWMAVAKILEKDGFKVGVAQPPETSLEDDVAATNRTIDAMGGPVILVGHSYILLMISGYVHKAHVRSVDYVPH